MALNKIKFGTSKLNDEDSKRLMGYVKTAKQKKEFRKKLGVSQQAEITWFRTESFPGYCKLYLDLIDMKEKCKLIPRLTRLIREITLTMQEITKR